MADAYSTLEDAARQARQAQKIIDQANALLASAADRITFSCSAQPFQELFEVRLPRTMWAPELQAQIIAVQARIDKALAAANALK